MKTLRLNRLAAAALASLAVPCAIAQTAGAPLSVSVLESTPTKTVLRITVQPPTLEPVQTPAGVFMRFAQRTFGSGGVAQESPGGAELPAVGFPLALPVDLDRATVHVEPEGTPRFLPDTLVFPVQKPETARAGEEKLPDFEFRPEVYFQSGANPGGELPGAVLFKGEANVQTFRFSPFGFDPQQKLVRWHPSYVVTVLHEAGGCFKLNRLANPVLARAHDGIDRAYEQLPLPALPFAINRALAERQICAPVFQPPVGLPPLSGARYLIVTHPNFMPAAQALAAHKQAQGISTEVVSTQTMAGGVSLTATAGQIRNWIANYWNSRLVRPKWVLFVGDAEFLPTNYDQVNIWDSARNAGDIWYGQFTPGATATTIPPFGIGRLPVDTLAQANTIVNKVIAFENSPPANPLWGEDYYSRLTFAAYFQSTGTTDERWFVETTEMVRNHAKGLGYNPQRIYYAPPGSDPRFYRSGAPIPAELRKPGFAWNGGTADINTAVNQGTALLYHRGHGWWNGWDRPRHHTGDQAGASVTGNRFPVVFSINCASGIFDNETVDLAGNIVGGGYGPGVNSVHWAEAFLRKSDGALAVIGDTRSSSTVDNNHLTLGLFDALFPTLLPNWGNATRIERLGDVLNHAKGFVAAVAGGATNNMHPLDVGGSRPGVINLRQQLNLYNLLGDPTVKLRTSPPWRISILNLQLVQGLARIRTRLDPVCLTCPPEFLQRPDFITAVALDPRTGRIVGRGLLDAEGNADIDLGNHDGPVWVRVASPDGVTTQAATQEQDTDNDGVPDSRDNCVLVKNADQLDSDSDGYGNACDGDLNNDGLVNAQDLALFRARFGERVRGVADFNGDGVVNAQDLALFRQMFGVQPGPSAWHLPSPR